MSGTPILSIKKPIILRKKSKSDVCRSEFVAPVRTIKVIPDQVIYRSNENDLFDGKYPNLVIVNKFNILNNKPRTVATYYENNSIVLLNSDEVSNIIGNDKYALLLKALDSIKDGKLKIQAILGLLTDNKRGVTAHKHCQTLESSMSKGVLSKRRIRPNRCKAYVIDSSVDTKTFCDTRKYNTTYIKKETVCRDPATSHNDDLVDLRLLLDEGSNTSCATDGIVSLRSCHVPNIPVLLENPISLLDSTNVNDTTSYNRHVPLKLIDGGTVTLRRMPQDFFHIASPDILIDLSDDDKRRVLVHQAYIDWKYCLQCDEDGNLPIHIAAINNDIELLRRHCAILKGQDASVDIVGKDSMTALQLAAACAAPASVAQLLRSGADVLRRDECARSVVHLAADTSVECVDVIVEFCRGNARTILQDEEDVWMPEFETKTDDELVQYLLDRLCSLCDDNGNTALMLASVKGDHATVSSLLAASPASVDIKMPTSGNTALYLAFQTAFIDAEESGNKKIIAQNYLEIIETLHAYGADPNIANDSGTSAAALTADFKVHDLSQAIVNKLLKSTSAKKSFDSYMLVKNKEGDLNVELVTTDRQKRFAADSKSGARAGSEVREEKKCVKKTVVFFRPNSDGNKETTKTLNIPRRDAGDRGFKVINMGNAASERALVLPSAALQRRGLGAGSTGLPLHVARIVNADTAAKNRPIKVIPLQLLKMPAHLDINTTLVQAKPNNAVDSNLAEYSFNDKTGELITNIKDGKSSYSKNIEPSPPIIGKILTVYKMSTAGSNEGAGDISTDDGLTSAGPQGHKRPGGDRLINAKRPRK